MKITNKAGLPEPLVRAVSNDPYDRGDADFTVTELLQPARAHALIKQHRDEIEVDASELIYALTGQIGHLILERAGDPRMMVEQRFYDILDCGDPYGKKIVSGRADLFTDEEETVLTDYKFTSIWTVKDGVPPDWTAQLNMLRWLAFRNKIPVTRLEIVAIFRDWSKPKSRRERDYPPTQVQVLPVKLWDILEARDLIISRIRTMLDAEQKLPLCTKEEKWQTDEKWAVQKHDAKRAIKLCDTERQARAIADQTRGAFVAFRRGEPKRCLDYCAAANWCEQFKSEWNPENESF